MIVATYYNNIKLNNHININNNNNSQCIILIYSINQISVQKNTYNSNK